MKKKWLISTVATCMVLAACGQNEEEQGTAMVDELTPIEVELDVPEKAEIGEVVTFSSTVTQGDDLVDDANEVVYEVWLEGQKEESEMIEAKDQEGNIYLLNHTFEEEGLYHVQTHVTARGLHRMPTAQIQVGEVVQKEEPHEEGAHKNEDEPTHEKEQEHAHEHQADVEVTTEVQDDRLVIQIALENSAYTGGNVTLEMWQGNEEERKWLDANEVGDGEYEIRNVEELSGVYSAIVHIQDKQVHEHVDVTLEF
ncbi:FixH family protein [Halalkalibacter nanhaiisediminis]|uniref:YtkA-like protein n=1 Tax=Halalkalibacter nanhaiisediminis TaxID=688079 RepID=A0A562QKM0_9BACI|nr:FixH family protein [Halalkalibacter nanhaiisediminis]TWI57223.1 YtkA-like protein [Halalkalibacter nanhaiisediminis]